MPSRRSFLSGLAASSLAPRVSWAALGNPVALSAARKPSGAFVLVGLTASGDIAFEVPLPNRGHAAAAHPQMAEAVAIDRRPGTVARVIDCAAGTVTHRFHAPLGHHFYGHAAFSSDGTVLYTPENQIETGRGWIGVWDRSLGYRRIDAFPSGGIGPHEILRLPSGDLAVANGGIRTHPKTGREKLNLDTMRPNLSIFGADGTRKDVADLPAAMYRNSLRHIATTSDGAIFCGFQWQGDPYDAPPLVAHYKGNGQLQMGVMEDGLLYRLDGYVGSVCATDTLRLASCPRGNALIAFDGDRKKTNTFHATDICGLCPIAAQTCLATDGTGAVYRVTASTLSRLTTHSLAFDNHLTALALL